MQEATELRQELGAWLGRSQAFELVANRCSAARAECLRNIRENDLHKTLGLDWSAFCEQHVGINRATADRLIQRLEEFGAAYFRLTQFMRISPEVYRQIAGSVTDDAIELDGELVPITRENTRRIAAGIRQMRQRLEAAKRAASQANEELRHLTDSTGAMSPQLERNSLQALQSRLEICVGDVAAFARRAEDHDNRMRLCAILGECSDRLHRLATTYNPNRTRPPV